MVPHSYGTPTMKPAFMEFIEQQQQQAQPQQGQREQQEQQDEEDEDYEDEDDDDMDMQSYEEYSDAVMEMVDDDSFGESSDDYQEIDVQYMENDDDDVLHGIGPEHTDATRRDPATSAALRRNIENVFKTIATPFVRKRVHDLIDKLQPLGHADFTFESYRNVLCHEFTSDDLDLIAKKFASLDRPLLQLVGRDKYKFPFCQQEWSQNTWFFRCKDCAVTDTSCVCMECFKNGCHIHEGHSYMPEESNQGGCCDCGNPDSWKSSGFCTNHFLPNNTIHPSSLLDPHLKKCLHLILRLITQHMIDLIKLPALSQQQIVQLQSITAWLENLSRESYPMSSILSEEFAQRSLDPTTFDLHNPVPLPYTTQEEGESKESFLPSAYADSPARICLQEILLKPGILNYIKTLFFVLIGNRSYKMAFCNEFLDYYPELSFQDDEEELAIVASIACQMFEIPSIIIPFCTGYTRKNLLSEIISVYKTLLQDKENYDFDDPTQRELFNQQLHLHQEFYYTTAYFKHVPICEYIYNNDHLILEMFSILDDIQEFVPFKRLLVEPLPFELPIIGNVVSMEIQAYQGMSNLFQTLHANNKSTLKYVSLILKNVKPGNNNFTHNGFVLPSSDIFHAIDSVSLHYPLNRVFGIFALHALHHAKDYSLAGMRSLITMEQLLYIANGAIKPSVLLSQYKCSLWEKNMNIGEYQSYYTWSLMWIDLFTVQYASILMGSEYFINFLISSFTSNFKQTNDNPSALAELLRYIIIILQLRVTPKFSQEEARYHIVQGLIGKYNTHSLLSSFRREFTFINIDDTIEEVAQPQNNTNKLTLKQKYWDRFDYYYPYHYGNGDGPTDLSLNSYHENLKRNKYPIDSFPLPAVLEPLHANLAGVNDLFDEPMLYHLGFSVLLRFIHPDLRNKTDFPLATYLTTSLVQSAVDLEAPMNHVLYMLVMALRHFKQSFDSMPERDQAAIHERIDLWINKGEFKELDQASKKNISILNMLRPYSVVDANDHNMTLRRINLLDLVSDLLQTIDKEGLHLDKKGLVTKLLILINEFDPNLSKYFHNRRLGIEDIANKQIEKEAQIKKEEALQRQKAIQERMMQQQQQFMKSNRMLYEDDDDEDEDDGDSSPSKKTQDTCVACKSGNTSLDNPLCAIGQVEGYGIMATAKKRTIEHYMVASPGKPVKNEYALSRDLQSIGRYFLSESYSSMSPAKVMVLFDQGFSMNVRCCDHLVHRKCLDNFVTDWSDGCRCPLCNRTSNILLAIDTVSKTEEVLEQLFLTMLSRDISVRNSPTVLDAGARLYIWKFPLSNIETLELVSRQTTLYSDDDTPYHVLSETDFQKRLKTLKLLFFNTMSIELHPNPRQQHNLFETESSKSDPFVLATYSYFLDRKQDPQQLMRKAYDRLIFLVFVNYIFMRLLALPPHPNSQTVIAVKKYYSTFKNYLASKQSSLEPNDDDDNNNNSSIIDEDMDTSATKETTTTSSSTTTSTTTTTTNNDNDGELTVPLMKKIEKAIEKVVNVFLRKAYLFHLCLLTDMSNPTAPLSEHVTLHTLGDVNFLLKKLNLPTWKECILQTTADFQLLMGSSWKQRVVYYLPPKQPKFIDLPNIFVDFFIDNIKKTCGNKCSKLPKGVCLLCGKLVCYGACCPDELMWHSHQCQNVVCLYIGITSPEVQAYASDKQIEKLNVYFDQFGEPSNKAKPNVKLSQTSLRNLYISWVQGLFHEKQLLQ
ncbi:hypothetical protein SAMD00019534_092770 [Acytostelium subglobosum LB1]|uniref:hypothetical protein n=1 Tax=Acytostelium subglobosum LB1 TaxID=1410327 RepID=UPI0006450069|nr:hypothetical protein SAMD00019534_092770 [Acytostelium subglobosum LB1]GAM26102.1 hypothetical protein SAMD00019534_092770 [Acytostelium subglobosum LB1]|eukprot:XP_012751145.1 hypothetical protein SAMD00019534_092770 [Acytostelium subglobosum LB1]